MRSSVGAALAAHKQTEASALIQETISPKSYAFSNTTMDFDTTYGFVVLPHFIALFHDNAAKLYHCLSSLPCAMMRLLGDTQNAIQITNPITMSYSFGVSNPLDTVGPKFFFMSTW